MLRRIVTVSLVLAFLLCGSAFAETGNITSTEIKFLGLDWYSDYDVVHDAVYDKWPLVLSINKEDEWAYYVDESYVQYFMNCFSDHADDCGAQLDVYNVTVAGYEADLELWFIHGIKDGKVLHTTVGSSLYYAIYEINNIEDTEPYYKDIVEKVTAIYGEPYAKYHDDIGYNLTEWKDTNGNFLLVKENFQMKTQGKREFKSMDGVTIMYVADGETTNKKIDEVDEIVYAQYVEDKLAEEDAELEKNKNNSDGL